MQVLIAKEIVEGSNFKEIQKTGASILVEGELVLTPEGVKQVLHPTPFFPVCIPTNIHFGYFDPKSMRPFYLMYH